MWMAPKRPACRAIEWTPADGRRKMVDQRRLGDQHLEKIYRQEESAGVRKRQWQPTVCAGETCGPLFHKGPEDLIAK